MLLINDNIAALGAENNLDATDSHADDGRRRSASGLQIQTAADNPAGYSIAQSLQSEINGYGASSLERADGGVGAPDRAGRHEPAGGDSPAGEHHRNAGGQHDDSLDSTAANADQQEFTALDRPARPDRNSTESFAGVNLLDGSNAALTFQVGPTDTRQRRRRREPGQGTSSARSPESGERRPRSPEPPQAISARAGGHQHPGLLGGFDRCVAEPDPGAVEQRHGRPAEPDLCSRRPRRRQRCHGDLAVHVAADPRAVRHVGARLRPSSSRNSP